MNINPAYPSQTALLAHCRAQVASGQRADAEQFYARLRMECPLGDPIYVEATEYLVRQRMQRGEVLSALTLLRSTPAPAIDSSVLQFPLGLCLKSIGDLAGAEQALSRASPSIGLARLHLAVLLDEQGRARDALAHYFGAITAAQMHGEWRDEPSTHPAIRPLVGHAMKRINEGRRALFFSLLDPLIQTFGASELARVSRALSIYLGDLEPGYRDAAQQPTFLYFPDIPAPRFYPREQFSWVPELERQTENIRSELLACLAEQSGIESVHQLDPEQMEQYVRSTSPETTWKGIYLYRHGEPYPVNQASCPQTVRAVESMPLARIPGHGPEILFSILDPGTEILPHRGVTNTRLVVHLPLIVPPNCVLKLSGEQYIWQEGCVVVFDDTFEHAAWNRSDHTRAILIADIWNPALTDVEQDAISRLVQGIGDFNRRCDL